MKINTLIPIAIYQNDIPNILFVDILNKKIYDTSGNELSKETTDEIINNLQPTNYELPEDIISEAFNKKLNITQLLEEKKSDVRNKQN